MHQLLQRLFTLILLLRIYNLFITQYLIVMNKLIHICKDYALKGQPCTSVCLFGKIHFFKFHNVKSLLITIF